MELVAALEDKESLHKELLSASDYIIQLEDRCYKANLMSLELIQTVRYYEERYEQEFDTLKSYIIDLKSRIPNFIPDKSDPVDVALAAYINSLPNRQ